MVEIQKIGNLGGTPPVERSGRAQGRRTGEAAGAAGADSLSISNQARFAQELERLLSAARASEDTRPGVVEAARSDVAAGTLASDAAISGAARSIAELLT